MLTMLCGSILNVEGAVGVYYSAANLLLGKQIYREHIAIAEQQDGNQDYFPVMLWGLVYQSTSDDGELITLNG